MDWYIFTEADRQGPAPAFRLPSTLGRPVSLDDYRQTTNLVLFFPSAATCDACHRALQGFAAHEAEYRAESTVILGIFPAPLEVVLPLNAGLYDLIPLLADETGQTGRAYAELLEADADKEDMLFVLDRYGAPLVALATGDPADPAIHKEILDWLVYSEIKCPE